MDNKIIKITKNKLNFVGISVKPDTTEDSGIAVLDEDLNIKYIDKAYRLNDIKFFVENLSNKDSLIISIDIPLNNMFLIGKWRQESKYYHCFTVGTSYSSKQIWSTRQSSRGSEIAQTLKEEGYDVFRYNSSYSKCALSLTYPLKSRSPAGCKYFQEMLKQKLGISGLTNNIMSFSALDAILGAYTSWQIYYGEQNKTFKIVNNYKDIPVISPIEKISC